MLLYAVKRCLNTLLSLVMLGFTMLLASANMLRSAIMLGSTVKLGFMVPLMSSTGSPREPQLARQPEPDWVRLSALPSRCCAVNAGFSCPESYSSTSTRASLASLQVC